MKKCVPKGRKVFSFLLWTFKCLKVSAQPATDRPNDLASPQWRSSVLLKTPASSAPPPSARLVRTNNARYRRSGTLATLEWRRAERLLGNKWRWNGCRDPSDALWRWSQDARREDGGGGAAREGLSQNGGNCVEGARDPNARPTVTNGPEPRLLWSVWWSEKGLDSSLSLSEEIKGRWGKGPLRSVTVVPFVRQFYRISWTWQNAMLPTEKGWC